MKNLTIYQNAPSHYHYYFNLVKTDDLLKELKKSKDVTQDLFNHISTEKENYAYQKGKWTTKEVCRHIIDCELIFVYRAFRFSRFDDTNLVGYDENKYINAIKETKQTMPELLAEYLSLRNLTISLFEKMNREMLNFKGNIGEAKVSTEALGFMIVGHNLHHCRFLEEKYLV